MKEFLNKWIWLLIGIPLTVVVFLPCVAIMLLWGFILYLISRWQKREKLEKYAWNLMVSVDQLGNAALGGDPDETISSRAGKMKDKSKLAAALSWILNKLDHNHVEDAREDDEGKDSILD